MVERTELSRRIATRLRKFRDDLEAGDLRAYRLTKVVIDEDGSVRRVVRDPSTNTETGTSRD